MTDHALEDQQRALQMEADSLLHDRGLVEILASYGTPHVTGSYWLSLMTWRDLDIYLDAPNLSLGQFFELGGNIAQQLPAWKISFTNHRDFPSTEGIVGLYFGIRTGELSTGGWKIDVWAMDSNACAERLAHCQAIRSKLTPDHRSAILRIKNDLWPHPEYRKSITSQQIYDAVIHKGLQTTDAFLDWHARREK